MFKTLGYYSLSANDLIAEDRNENSGKCLTLSGCSGRSMESNTKDTLAGGWAAIAAYKNTNAEKNTAEITIKTDNNNKEYGSINITEVTDGGTSTTNEYIYDYDENNDPTECYKAVSTDDNYCIDNSSDSTTYLDINYIYAANGALIRTYNVTCTLRDTINNYSSKVVFTSNKQITMGAIKSVYDDDNNDTLKISSTSASDVETELKTASEITLTTNNSTYTLQLELKDCTVTETGGFIHATTVNAKYLVYAKKYIYVKGLKYHELHTINKISAGNITAVVLDADNKLKQIFVKEEENEESHSIIGNYSADTKYYYIARNNNSDKS